MSRIVVVRGTGGPGGDSPDGAVAGAGDGAGNLQLNGGRRAGGEGSRSGADVGDGRGDGGRSGLMGGRYAVLVDGDDGGVDRSVGEMAEVHGTVGDAVGIPGGAQNGVVELLET